MDFEQEFFGEEDKTIIQRLQEFSEGFNTFDDVAATMIMFVIALLKSIGTPIALLMVMFVDHDRYREATEVFLNNNVAWWGAAFFVFLIVLIPQKSVFSRLRNNDLEFNKERKNIIKGFTFVKVWRRIRFISGIWNEFELFGMVVEELDVEEVKQDNKTALEWFEILLITSGSLLAFFASINHIEGLIVEQDSDVWYAALAQIFSGTNLYLFMPALGASLFTFVTTVAATVLSREMALDIAKRLWEREEKKAEELLMLQQRLEEEEKLKEIELQKELEENTLTILEASVHGRFWTNLQKIDAIEINEDKVDVTENQYRFYDSHVGMWLPDTYDSKQKLKIAISKQMELR